MIRNSFTAGEVHDLLGINTDTLRVWKRRGQFVAEQTEGWSRYSFADLVSMAVGKKLMEAGIAVSIASNIASGHCVRSFAHDEQEQDTFLVIRFDGRDGISSWVVTTMNVKDLPGNLIAWREEGPPQTVVIIDLFREVKDLNIKILTGGRLR